MVVAEIQAASIVLLGSFNPTIFQPRWLGTQNLIRPEEADSAKITVIQSEVSDFSTEWFQLQVLQSRLLVSTQDPRQFAPLRDLVAAFCTILPHTPVTAAGFNREFHCKMSSEEAWHAIGDVLAPKESWSRIMVKPRPGLRSMVMQGARAENGGIVLVKIEPSTRVEFGVYISLNEEFKKPDGASDGAQWVSEKLAEQWEASGQYSELVASHLLGLAKV